jgi:hypothetical protein
MPVLFHPIVILLFALTNRVKRSSQPIVPLDVSSPTPRATEPACYTRLVLFFFWSIGEIDCQSCTGHDKQFLQHTPGLTGVFRNRLHGERRVYLGNCHNYFLDTSSSDHFIDIYKVSPPQNFYMVNLAWHDSTTSSSSSSSYHHHDHHDHHGSASAMSFLNRAKHLCFVCFQSTWGFGYPSFSNSSLDSLAYGAKMALPLTSFSSGTHFRM